MNTCPNCSHSLLAHLRSHSRYWYCQHCRLETSNSFIKARNKTILRKSLRPNPNRSSFVTADSFI